MLRPLAGPALGPSVSIHPRGRGPAPCRSPKPRTEPRAPGGEGVVGAAGGASGVGVEGGGPRLTYGSAGRHRGAPSLRRCCQVSASAHRAVGRRQQLREQKRREPSSERASGPRAVGAGFAAGCALRAGNRCALYRGVGTAKALPRGLNRTFSST